MTITINPPVAKVKPKTLEKHGDVRTDNYYWLNERENPEVIDYLNKENEYYETMTAGQKRVPEGPLRRNEGPHQGRRFIRALFLQWILLHNTL